MGLPYLKIALVGRPNVGKSHLFNRMSNKRISIVDEMEGVTRDRLYAYTEYFGTPIQLIDTAGIDPQNISLFNQEMIAQSELAIAEADAVILVVDGTVGVQPLDRVVNQLVRKCNKPYVLAINKMEGQNEQHAHEFFSLNAPHSVEVSAMHGRGIEELYESVLDGLTVDEVAAVDEGIKLAIIGRPNVGKSTFLNAVLGEKRVVVSDQAGTTRDSIDAHIEIDGQSFTLIDTAGIRRRHKELNVVEKFAAIRTQRAIERADICLFMIDAVDGLTTQEKGILSDIEKAKKGCILFVNKWDQISNVRMEHAKKDLFHMAPQLRFYPIIFGSALTQRNISEVFKLTSQVYSELTRRIPTSELNHFLERTMQLNHPPMIQGKRLRIYYMSQIETAPPQFILFINYKDRMTDTYERYLMNAFREKYSFLGIPLTFYLRKKSQKELPHMASTH
ncbi:MAG: ribosome biogenesis GTPase Der [Simkaniaceae bacterium]|nr:ribosome biogenesis GTPase Der [Simkaniaceae bacterium]MCF7851929.1 ribosome biogenesis GTPase Der [Simkaniaceae bacterium]